MLIIAQVLKEEWLEITGFAHSQATNKLVNIAANDSARVSGQDRKKPPARKLRKKINDDILQPQVAQNFLKSGSKVAFYIKLKVRQVKY